MDSNERLFVDIAVRLQLLTREQAASCEQQARRAPGKSIADTAVELGLMSKEEAGLVRVQQARVAERQKGAPPSAPTPKFVETVSDHGPPAEPTTGTRPQPDAAARKRRGPRSWDAPTQPQQGMMRVPSVDGRVPPSRQALEQADTGQVTRPGVPPESSDLEAFPLAEGANAAAISAQPIAAPGPRAAGSYPGAAGATVMQPFVAPQPDGDAQARARTNAALGTAATLIGASAPSTTTETPRSSAGSTLVQARASAPAAEPTHTPTLRPPTAVEQRPGGQVTPSESYLGKALALALRSGASDLHVHSGAPLLARVDGQVRPLSGTSIVSAEAAEKIIAEIATDAQWLVLSKKGEVDFAYEMPGLLRARVNIYRQQRGLDAVFRLIPLKPPSLEELGLPQRLTRLVDFRTGMVLCTGPAGCGKSTTLAALLSALIQSREEHVLTIEDPVEHVYPPGRALVNQRQVRDHTSSFARALRAALREDPDVIAITELRDRETIGLAISAAETGHLVLGTLHTGNAVQTINRIVSSFPADEQEQVRAMLAESLRAVVSQRLVPKASGKGRVPAIELMMVTHAVSNLIREDKTHQLPSVMQTGKAAGMITLDDSLDELVRAQAITPETARRFAVRKERFG
ncbi:MAG: PilT/PilU family type 4a pilus ATPase [Polyangiales bacterium]